MRGLMGTIIGKLEGIVGGMGGDRPPFVASDLTVLDKDGNPFAVTFSVLDKDGNPFTITADVLDKDGNTHTVI